MTQTHFQLDYAVSNITKEQAERLAELVSNYVDNCDGYAAGNVTEMDQDWHPVGVPARTALRLHWEDVKFHLGLLFDLIKKELRRHAAQK
jgi:hypothetical protein